MGGAAQPGEVVAAIVARNDMHAFSDLVLDSFWDRPEFRPFRPPREELRGWVEWNIELVVRWLVDDRPPDPSDVDRFRDLARTLAREGVPPDLVPANFRRAARFAWSSLLAAARDDERPALLASADRLFDFVDLASQLFHEAYESGAPTPTTEERQARGLLQRLITGSDMTIDDRELAERIGLAASGPLYPFVTVAAGRTARDHAALAADLRRRGSLAASEGRRVAGVAATRIEPAGALYAPGGATAREDLRDVLDELRALTDVASARGRTGAVHPEDHLPELLLRRSPRLAGRVAARVYGALDTDLVRTLDLLVEHDFDRARTAAALPAHRNTLINRLRRIREITGIDVDSADGRGLVWLAWLEHRGR